MRRICFDTGMMGASIAPQYGDFPSWADSLTSYYTDAEPEHAQVVVQGDEVVGYLLSTSDERRCWNPMWIAFKHCLFRGICFRPHTMRFYVRSVVDIVRDLFKPGRPDVDLDRYPGHTHSNLKPAARRGGKGTELFYRLFDQLKSEGVRGMHAEIMLQNKRTLDWACSTLGYTRLGEPYPLPGLRDANGERIMLQMIVLDFADWKSGAWKTTAH